MEKAIRKQLSGWGRHPVEECAVYRPERRGAIAEILASDGSPHYIARGLGRSYADTALNKKGGVIDLTRLNRMISFAPDTGILECEGGVSLAEIIEVFLPRGFFLPVTPGTKFVTVGGAIANDVHGKNHHRDGTFGNFVLGFELLTPAGEVLTCSPSEHADVFWATVGGIGLTGVILTARIRLQRVETAYIRVEYRRASNIHEALAAMKESDKEYQYSVAWIDCLARGRNLGRAVLMWGNHARMADLAGRPEAQSAPLAPPPVRPLSVPVDLPGFVLNPLSIKAFNTLYYAAHPSVSAKIVDYDRYFYPLDGILNWNRMYGKRGFVQFQATFPPESLDGLVELVAGISQSSRASFLAVLKCFGAAGQGLLSHPMPGYTLTLDIANRSGLAPILNELNRRVVEAGGRIYLAKDSSAKAEAMQVMYPKLGEFREIQARVDPNGVLSSSMARRLGLVNGR